MPTYSALSDRQPVIASLAPVSTAAGTVSLGYVDMRNWTNVQFVVQVAAGGGTITAAVQQATTVGGTGAKALATPKTIASTTTAGVYVVNVRGTDLDTNNAYEFVALSITVAGSATVVGGVALGDPEATPPTAANGAIAVQVVQ